MTQEAFDFNLKRIQLFYNDDRKVPEVELTPDGLLKRISWVLDVHGAPQRNVSMLILKDDDFLELKDFAKENAEHFMWQTSWGIDWATFEYYGFRWDILSTKNFIEP